MQRKSDGLFFNAFEDLITPDGKPLPARRTRKKNAGPTATAEEKQENLLKELVIVGYESQLFRNDKLSASMEKGSHLIPWMGNRDLLIDRYDVRALLDSEKLFDKDKWDPPKKAKTSGHKWEREQKLQRKLEKERYWDMVLHTEDVYKGT